MHHETIYQIVYADKADGGDLYTHLQVLSKPYRKRYGHYDRRGKIRNRVDITERPAVVEDRGRIYRYGERSQKRSIDAGGIEIEGQDDYF